MSATCYGLKATICFRLKKSPPKIPFIQSTTIFKNYSLIGVTYLQIGFNKSLRNIKNTDRMVYTNKENTLTEITSESVS